MQENLTRNFLWFYDWNNFVEEQFLEKQLSVSCSAEYFGNIMLYDYYFLNILVTNVLY